MAGARPDTWMPVFIGDYLSDTMHLTRDQHGGYILLIFAYWRRGGPLPDDDNYLAAIVKATPAEWRRLRPVLAAFFHIGEGRWHHKRINTELTGATSRTEERSRAGSNGAAKRWQKHGSANGKPIAEPMANASDSQWQTDAPSPSPSSSSLRSEGADAPPGDPVKALFDAGVRVLTAAGTPQKQARSLIGKWRRDLNDDGKLFAIVIEAAEHHAVEPVAWIAAAVTAALKPKSKGLYGGAMM